MRKCRNCTREAEFLSSMCAICHESQLRYRNRKQKVKFLREQLTAYGRRIKPENYLPCERGPFLR